jgi:hypothetical protein
MKSNILLESTFLLAFMFFSYPFFAQKKEITNPEMVKIPCTLFASFLMQGPYPGFRVGVELPLKKTNYEKSSIPMKTKEQAAQFSVGFYHHGGFNTNFFLTSEYAFRRTGAKGFISEIKAGLSLSRTFLGASAYEVDEKGQVSQQKGAGNFYFMPSLSFGLGKDFSKTTAKLPLSIYTNFNAVGLLPYNGFVLPLPIFELGVRFQMSSMPQRMVKMVTRQK